MFWGQASEKCSFEKKQVCLVFLFENWSKFSHFCLNSFSAVSTYFSILSSLSARIRPHLAPEAQNFRSIDEKMMKNLHSKCEKCNFDQNFRPRKKILFFHFLQYGARSRPPVDGIERKTQKFIGTEENEPIQNSSKFIKISSKSTVKMKSLPRNRTKNIFKNFRNYRFIGFFPGPGGGQFLTSPICPEWFNTQNPRQNY